ncbi:hypothetical protein F5Y03DRAFT_369790 [Xylaria venustula]|nr:hypothetical protein F5Y03DRAFT_369790 [Xylaria venustula]
MQYYDIGWTRGGSQHILASIHNPNGPGGSWATCWASLRLPSWVSRQKQWNASHGPARRRLSCQARLGNQAIRLHEATRTNSDSGSSAKMAPVWADRESASCGLNTIKHASGCSDDTLL